MNVRDAIVALLSYGIVGALVANDLLSIGSWYLLVVAVANFANVLFAPRELPAINLLLTLPISYPLLYLSVWVFPDSEDFDDVEEDDQ
jgi:hypothetical protein